MIRNQRAARDVRRRLPAYIGAGGVALLLLAAAVPATAAGPKVRAIVYDGTLRISGTPFSDQIGLRLSARDPNQLQVDIGDDGSADFTFDRGTFGAIDVAAGNGADKVRIDDVNGAFTTTESTRIDGQNGDDRLTGGSGNEIFVGGRGNDFVDGNQGADTAFLGRGDDTFVWDQGDGSDIVEGGRGFDTLVFNGFGANEIMAATASGGRVLFTRVQGNIVMDLDDVEAIDVRPLGGTDTVTVNDLTGTDLARVDVDLAAAPGGSAGDGLADIVTVRGTTGDDTIAANASGAAIEVSGLAALVRITHADAASDRLVIDTLAGADDVALDPALAALILVSVL
jgi:RTX calcium-binding nonapeptide repeat (4 copies)